jgi:hypothetical protein
MSNERGERGLVAAAAARHYRDLLSSILEVYDLVLDVACDRWVCLWDAEERSVDKVGGIVDEVFCCNCQVCEYSDDAFAAMQWSVHDILTFAYQLSMQRAAH